MIQVHDEKVSSKITSLNHYLCTLFTSADQSQTDCELEKVLDI